jgi:glycosyltransferase involved in cell wall biosynthesis
MNKLVILLSSYNNESIIAKCIKSCLYQSHEDLEVVVADDGSSDKTVDILKSMDKTHKNLHILSLPHGERGIARKKAIEKAWDLSPEYIYIIDSDMILKKDLAEKCIAYFQKNKEIGGLIIPEEPFSKYTNFFSKVKVFERSVINRAGKKVGSNSIEAARFWKSEEYKRSGGINFNQIAFEETQPTIRYIEMGGYLERGTFTGVNHDEKEVTLKNILEKKRYYFSVMNKTTESEKNGTMKAIKRWYFFRGVLYRKENIIEYIKHPRLTFGMIYMYIALTFVWLCETLKGGE